MNWISGIIMLCGVAGMTFWFRPKERDSLLLCGIGLFIGVLSLLMSDGLLPLQAVEQGMQAVILGLCFVQLRREKKARSARRRMVVRKGKAPAPASPKGDSKACA